MLIGQWGLEWCGTESVVVESSLQTASSFIYLVINCGAMRPLSERSLGVTWVWLGRDLGVAWVWLGRDLGVRVWQLDKFTVLSTMDLWALATMKNAARCEKQCDLHV